MAVKKKEHNKNTDSGFVPIRRGLYEHLSDGRMTGKELMVYTTLHLKADHQTGICYKVSGVALGLLLKESTNYINRVMCSLERKGYIKRLSHRGQIRYYPVVINKYLTSSGILINASKTLSLKDICWYVEEDCTLTAFQQHINCISKDFQMHTLQYIKNIKKTNTKKPSQGRGDKTFSLDSIEFSLAKLLYDAIRQRKPDFIEPNLQAWAGHIDLMIRIDKRNSDQIEQIIQWCQQDDFWQDNILCTKTLRRQFDQLELKMKKKGFKQYGSNSGSITGNPVQHTR